MLGRQPRLLGQFAAHGVERVLVHRRPALGHFPGIAHQGETVLPDQRHRPVLVQRQDPGPHVLGPHRHIVGRRSGRRRRRMPRHRHPGRVDQDALAVADPFRRFGQVFGPAGLDVGNIVHPSAMAPGAMKS
ncbi:hypothetical protein D3C71_1807710 [compost metagenome]